MYVVAVGISDYAEKGLGLRFSVKDARSLAELFQRRSRKFHDRVDVVPILDRDATKAAIEDAIKDVAELTRPQDTLAVILCGNGATVEDHFYFAPHDFRFGADRPADAIKIRGLAVDELAAAMGSAAALQRVLIVDAATSGAGFSATLKGSSSEFSLRGAVERWAKFYGIHSLVGMTFSDGGFASEIVGHGLLTHALLASASEIDGEAAGDQLAESVGPFDVKDWFPSAAERARPLLQRLNGSRQAIETDSLSRGFPILALDK
jgi:uncharacterized caspase-like protein